MIAGEWRVVDGEPVGLDLDQLIAEHKGRRRILHDREKRGPPSFIRGAISNFVMQSRSKGDNGYETTNIAT